MKLALRHVLLACGLFTCSLSSALAASLAVCVATVELTPQATSLQMSGRIWAVHSVAVRARTGGTLIKMHIRDGQYVGQGDLLYELDDAEPRSALALAQAELQSTQARRLRLAGAADRQSGSVDCAGSGGDGLAVPGRAV